MDPANWQELCELFEAARQTPEDRRSEFLDASCAHDKDLRAQVESLLLHDSGGGGSLKQIVDQTGQSLHIGRLIGSYRLTRELGHGGMGEVWLAVRADDAYEKEVAIKLMLRGLHDRQLQQRFQAERQILASLEHSNIARLVDGGTAEDGTPYVVMEHVEGQRVDRFCDDRGWTTRQRLDLFRQICSAVSYAHRNLVIHRDIKPGNILVDADGVPKLIDFGIAKLVDPTSTAQTAETGTIGRLLTPEYASPEQVRGDTITTASDVYSLGVLLYELLTGRRPYELDRRTAAEMERVICEQAPERPSTAVTRESAEGEPPAAGLRRQLHGDLDNIVLMALRKEPERRYATVDQLSEDIRRHLDGLPVIARPGGWGYRASKFVGRHKIGVGAAVAGLSMLVAFAVTMTVQTQRTAVARNNAERARDDLESVAAFQAGMLSDVDAAQLGKRLIEDLRDRVGDSKRAGGLSDEQVVAAVRSFESAVRDLNATDVALRLIDEEILDRATQTLAEKFGDRPLIDARLRSTIGETYRKLGRYERAEPQFEKALEIRKRVLGDAHPESLRSTNNLAILYHNQGRYDEAEPLYLQILETMKRVLGAEHPDTLVSTNNLAVLYKSQGRYDEAEPLYLEAFEIQNRKLGEEHSDTIMSMANLANLYHRQGRDDEAEPLFLQTIEIEKRVSGDDHPNALMYMNNLAILYAGQGRYDEAESLYLAALETQKRVLGDDHPDTARSLYNLACFEALRGHQAKAMGWLRQSVAAGYSKADWMRRDSDLEILHGPEFDILLEQARDNAAAQRAEAGTE